MAASSSNQNSETLVETLQKMLKVAPQQSEECCIYRVPELLRRLNPTLYTPMAFPIGPIHNNDHGHDSSEADNPELVSNRVYKLKFLKSFFQKHQRLDPEDFRETVKRRITDIRRCYSYRDSIFENAEIFIDMILLDCIFIIQLFLEHQSSLEESIFMAPLKVKEIASDLILAENQLPFFILRELCEQFQGDSCLFYTLACRFLKIQCNEDEDGGKTFHILDLLRDSLLPSCNLVADVTDFPRTMLKRPYNENDIDLQEIMYPTATGLSEAGIRFRVTNGAFSILDIRFDVKKGILYIPKLRVDDRTERKFRNLIAFEQSHTKDTQSTSVLQTLKKLTGGAETELLHRLMEVEESFIIDPNSTNRKLQWEEISIVNPMQVDADVYPLLKEYTYITDYLFFMDCLINTPADVKLLTKSGIIENWLGSEKNLSELINSMGIHAYHFTGGYLYSHVARELNIYHKKKGNRHVAVLKQWYFRHPWAIIGLISAGVLLLLTIAQVALAAVAL